MSRTPSPDPLTWTPPPPPPIRAPDDYLALHRLANAALGAASRPPPRAGSPSWCYPSRRVRYCYQPHKPQPRRQCSKMIKRAPTQWRSSPNRSQRWRRSRRRQRNQLLRSWRRLLPMRRLSLRCQINSLAWSWSVPMPYMYTLRTLHFYHH